MFAYSHVDDCMQRDRGRLSVLLVSTREGHRKYATCGYPKSTWEAPDTRKVALADNPDVAEACCRDPPGRLTNGFLCRALLQQR